MPGTSWQGLQGYLPRPSTRAAVSSLLPGWPRAFCTCPTACQACVAPWGLEATSLLFPSSARGAQCRREMLAPPVCPHSALPWDGQLGGATLALPSHSSAFLLGLSRCGENFVLVGFLLPSGGGEGYFRSQFKVRQLGLASGEAGTVAAHTEGGPLVSLEAKRLGRRWLQ